MTSTRALHEASLGPTARGYFTTRRSPVLSRPWDEHYGSFNLAGHVGDDPARVAQARTDLAEELGLPDGSFAWMQQTHSTTVALARLAHAHGQEPEADALIFDREDPACAGVRGLGVLVADCVPLLLASADGRFLAAIHAGRRGMLGGIVGATLEALAERGAHVQDLYAAIGPCICGACYEVPEAMRAEAAALEPACFATTRQGSAGIDVAAGVIAQLERAGLTRLIPAPACTLEDERFYSYRRDPVTGRLAGIVCL